MRISDWSSDVCSSDLVPGNHRVAVDLLVDAQARHVFDPFVKDRIIVLPASVLLFFPAHHRFVNIVGLAVPRIVDNTGGDDLLTGGSEEHTSELQSLMRISYAVFCLTKKKN